MVCPSVGFSLYPTRNHQSHRSSRHYSYPRAGGEHPDRLVHALDQDVCHLAGGDPAAVRKTGITARTLISWGFMDLTRFSRRSALRLLATAPAILQASARSQSNQSSRTMYLALNSVLVSGRVPWPAFPKLAAKVGFPGCDVMLKPAMQAGVAATNNLYSSLKLRPGAIDFPVEFRKDEATFKAGLPNLEQAAPFAKDIDCPRMVT